MEITRSVPSPLQEHDNVRPRQPRPYCPHPRRPWFRRARPAPARRAGLQGPPRRRPARRRDRRRARRRLLPRHRRAGRRPLPPHRRRRRPARLPRQEVEELVTAVDASVRDLTRTEASPVKVWTALWIVYIVWGSTYLAI